MRVVERELEGVSGAMSLIPALPVMSHLTSGELLNVSGAYFLICEIIGVDFVMFLYDLGMLENLQHLNKK